MYYVYVATVEGEVVYVGKGSGTRSSHINSGISHSYKANKSHFSGVVADVELVATNLNEIDAYELESHIIKEVRPKWNVVIGAGRDFKRGSYTNKYLGVSYVTGKPTKPYRAWYKHQYCKKHVGYFDSAIEAANARDMYVIKNKLPAALNNTTGN